MFAGDQLNLAFRCPRRAFGARDVLAELWSLPDKSRGRRPKQEYRFHIGRSVPEAPCIAVKLLPYIDAVNERVTARSEETGTPIRITPGGRCRVYGPWWSASILW